MTTETRQAFRIIVQAVAEITANVDIETTSGKAVAEAAGRILDAIEAMRAGDDHRPTS